MPSTSASPQRRLFNREMVVGALRKSLSQADVQVPGAFPTERSASPGLNSDLEYDYDGDTDLDLYESDESSNHGVKREERDDILDTSVTERGEEDDVSDSSLDDMYSAEDFSSEDNLYDGPLPSTPPSSSQPTLGSPKSNLAEPDSIVDPAPLPPAHRPNRCPVIPPIIPPPDIQLSEEQQHVLNQVIAGESVFFTGSAGASLHKVHSLRLIYILFFVGTGKSVLLRAIIDALGGPSHSIAVTASTGAAAANIGGGTLHAFAGKSSACVQTRCITDFLCFLC